MKFALVEGEVNRVFDQDDTVPATEMLVVDDPGCDETEDEVGAFLFETLRRLEALRAREGK